MAMGRKKVSNRHYENKEKIYLHLQSHDMFISVSNEVHVAQVKLYFVLLKWQTNHPRGEDSCPPISNSALYRTSYTVRRPGRISIPRYDRLLSTWSMHFVFPPGLVRRTILPKILCRRQLEN